MQYGTSGAKLIYGTLYGPSVKMFVSTAADDA